MLRPTARSPPVCTTWRPTTRSRSRRASRFEPGTWHHLALTYDGSSRAAGIGLFVDGEPRRPRWSSTTCGAASSTTQEKSTGVTSPPMRLGRRGDETLEEVTVDELRVFDRAALAARSAALAGVADPLGAVAARRRRRRARAAQRRRCASTTSCASIATARARARGADRGRAARRTTLLTSLHRGDGRCASCRRRAPPSCSRAAPTTRRPSA